jgi:hypothetical protein
MVFRRLFGSKTRKGQSPMSRFLAVVLCAVSVFATPSFSQVPASSIEPIRVPAGTILAFHLQTRLRHTDGDPIDAFPKGTVLHVKIVGPIDSDVDRDGSEFRGTVAADLSIGEGVVIHSDAEVRGLLVLLRSKTHPNGFRYELLLTELSDHGKSYLLTASLNNSFFDSGPQPAADASSPNSATKVEARELPKASASGNTKLTVNPQR